MLCFACPNCHEVMSAPEDAVGETVACPMCYQYLQVPTAAAAAAQNASKKKVKAPAAPKGYGKPAPPPPPRPQVKATPPAPAPPSYAPAPAPAYVPPRPPRQPLFKPREALQKARNLLQGSGGILRAGVAKAKRLPIWVWLLAGAVGIGILLFGGPSPIGSPHRPTPIGKAKYTPTIDDDPDLNLSAFKLFQEYQKNVFAADDKYKDKILTIVGDVDSVDRSGDDSVVIYLQGGGKFDLTKVQCLFDKSFESEAVKITRGQRVKITGVCTGRRAHVILKKCEFIH